MFPPVPALYHPVYLATIPHENRILRNRTKNPVLLVARHGARGIVGGATAFGPDPNNGTRAANTSRLTKTPVREKTRIFSNCGHGIIFPRNHFSKPSKTTRPPAFSMRARSWSMSGVLDARSFLEYEWTSRCALVPGV